jgi:hypothetical protein
MRMNMATFDLYGLQSSSLEAACDTIEAVLGIKLVAHESGYHGGAYYRLGQAGSEHFILQCNYDSFDDEWAEPESREQAYLLYVNETGRAQDLERRLVGAGRLLRREEL